MGGAFVLGSGVLLGGTAGRPAGASTVGANTGDARAGGVSRPYIFHRAQWGARRPKVPATVLARRPDHIVVHHTASPNSTTYTTHHAAALSRSIQAYHMDHNGWDDVGQQFTISRGGYLMEGRNRTLFAVSEQRHVVGAQTANENSHTLGIENEGTYRTATPTPALWNGLVRLCAWLCAHYGLDPGQAIVGHRDYNATQCPGDRLYAMLPRLRREVAARLDAGDLLSGGLESPISPSYAPDRPLAPSRHEFDHGPALGPHDRTR